MIDLLRIKCNSSLVLLDNIGVFGNVVKLDLSLRQFFKQTSIFHLYHQQFVYFHPHLDYSVLIFLQSTEKSNLVLRKSPIGFTQI